MRRILQIFMVIFFGCSFAYSQSAAHGIFKDSMLSKKVPGFAFLIAKDGKILDEGYYGKADLELDAAISERSVFAIASMTKTFTAAAILLLSEKGFLRLDDPIKKYIPEAPATWDSMAIKHLLMHSSGLVEDWELYDWNTSNEIFLKTQTDEGFLELHFNQELQFPPGTDTRYASGHFILGKVIERISGLTYEEYLKENIFNPLSLNETYVDHPYKIIPHRVSGYYDYDTKVVNAPVSGIGNGILIAPVAYGRGDAGIRTTARDLLKFYNALFSNDFLNEQSRQMMFQPAVLDNGDYVSFGAGWMNWPLGGMAISEHSGIYRIGFSSQALAIPKEKFVVIILTNLRGAASFPLAQKLAAMHYPELGQLSGKLAVEDTHPGLTKIHLEFFQSIKSGTTTSNVNKEFPFSYYSKSLQQAFSETESITFLGERHVKEEGVHFFNADIHKLRYYRLNGKETRYTTVYLDKANKLVFMDYPDTQ